MPAVRWRAVLLGLVLAAATSLVIAGIGRALASEPLALLATPAGIAGGAYLAGRIAGSAGLLQGSMVAVLWIALEALGEIVTPPSTDVGADVVTILLSDGIRLLVGAAFGRLGAPR